MKETESSRPPFLLHLLAAIFTIAALLSIVGIAQTLRSWNWLLVAGYYPHPLYVVFKSSLLALFFLAMALFLWLRVPFAPRLCQWLGGLVFLWFWFDRLVLTRNPLPVKAHLLPLVVTVLTLAFVGFSAWLLEPFMKVTDRPQKDETEE